MKIFFKICYLLIIFFISSHSNAKICVTSIPKSGTHLLTKCVSLVTSLKQINMERIRDRTGLTIENTKLIDYIYEDEFLQRHITYSKQFEDKIKNENIKTLFIYRDPRDQVISRALWIREKPVNYRRICDEKRVKNLTQDQLIDYAIGEVAKEYEQFLPWLNSKIVCSVKFEKLIGPLGGGKLYLQKQEFRKICNYLHVDHTKIEDYCLKNIFGDSPTFRKGQIGRWKEFFTPKRKIYFKNKAGYLLIKLGYEKNYNW